MLCCLSFLSKKLRQNLHKIFEQVLPADVTRRSFLALGNADETDVERLRDDGHFVWYVAEMAPSISDDEVLKIANNESAPLITSDKDFAK